MENNTLVYILIILVALSTILPVVVSLINNKRQHQALEEQMKKREAYLKGLKIGDEVILLSGFHGKIVSIKDTIVALQVNKEMIVYVEKDSIMGKAKELLFTK